MPLITINQMQKYYGDNHVLKGVDLDIDMGEVISIIGRSGSGKSTLLRCINGLEGYQEGSIKLGGMTITDRDSQAREISRSVGMVFQSFNLIPYLTAQENVELPLMYRGIPRRQRREAAREALEQVGLLNRADHRPCEMSGGQQQRTAIARAIAARPSMILADEPCGNLDSRSGRVVCEILEALHMCGKTIVMITHDENTAKHAERLIRIADGKIACG